MVIVPVLVLSAMPTGLPHETLLTWAMDHGATLGPVTIAPSLVGGGMGVFAAREVDVDELLFAVPKRIHVNLRAAYKDADIGAAIEQRAKCGDGMGALCTFIAKQHLCGDVTFAPYFNTLGLDAPAAQHVQFWSDGEMDLLAGTAAYDRATKVCEDADQAAACALQIPGLQAILEHANLESDASLERKIADVRGIDANGRVRMVDTSVLQPEARY